MTDYGNNVWELINNPVGRSDMYSGQLNPASDSRRIEHPIIIYIRDAIDAIDLLPEGEDRSDLEDKLKSALALARSIIYGKV